MVKDILKLLFVAFLLFAAASNTAPQTSFLPKCPASVTSASQAQWCDFSLR